MIDLREYKGIVLAAVAKEREADENWSWCVKAVNKSEIKIGWGYLDYIGEKTPFKVTICEGDEVEPVVVGTIPNGHQIYAFVGPGHWNDYRTIEEAVAGVVHSMAVSAHKTY